MLLLLIGYGIPVPPLVIPPEDRTAIVYAEIRTAVVEEEDRTVDEE